MIAKRSFALLAVVTLGLMTPSAQAQDPFAFQFGYVLGYQNSFRNRLPAPPYFAIYPPVYYGARHQRPYGESPFASFPLLQPAPNYFTTPKQVPYRSSSILNHHLPHDVASPASKHQINEPVASNGVNMGRTVQILNPYAQPQVASK